MTARVAPHLLSPLDAPPDGNFPRPPVESLAMVLPFGELSWENFERLCYQLARRTGQVEDVQRYGRQGQAQAGIDVFARKPNGRYDAWQSKRYKAFGPSNVRKAVKAFREGNWRARSDTLFLAVQARIDDAALQDEIEAQAEILRSDGVVFVVLGGDGLTDRLRSYPDLVHAFFGRAWTKAFYGETTSPAIVASLDGLEFAKVRAQLGRVYTTRFNALDPGAITSSFVLHPASASPAPDLLGRYAIPDIIVRERRIEAAAEPATLESAASRSAGEDAPRPRTATAARETVRRAPVTEWLLDADQFAIVANAGAGKSTLLRCVALDLLGDQSVFPSVAARWGDRIPIFVSFAKWVRVTAVADGEVGLKDLVDAVLQPLLTVDMMSLVDRAIDEGRIVLLVDGLDEWSSEQPARVAFHTLLTYAEAHGLPALASGRPSGLRRIGALPQTWKVGELAPLSARQQRRLAQNWFRHQHIARSDVETAEAAATWSADRFLSELKRDGALAELATNPLMFMGLVALAMREVALPRDRCQALGSLVQILLDVHPERRATAAGDVRPRFEHGSLALRQDALGSLAFASRRDGGDAGYPREQAATVMVAHLTEIVGISGDRASAVTSEILAINAETLGLLVEKAPGEIGFAHASLEEFLGAAHIQSWPLTSLLDFVSAEAGNPRWRNVLRNLVALNQRPNEIDEIVKRLEGAPVDSVGDLERRRLLAEIAFGPSAMRSGTAMRLANDVFAAIDGPGFADERVALARIVLAGLGDPVLGPAVAERVARWAPRRFRFGMGEFDALSHWPQGEDLLETLFAGLMDDENVVRHSAAKVLARRYGGDAVVERRLRALITGRAELAAVVAALEALVRGWPKANLDDLLSTATRSSFPELRALALLGRVNRGQCGDLELRTCFELLCLHSHINYGNREIFGDLLRQGWPDDPRVVTRALHDVCNRHEAGTLDYDIAIQYLRSASPSHPDLCDWMLAQLDKQFPFNEILGDAWQFLVPFAQADLRIREAAIQYVLEQSEFNERDVWPLIAGIKDARLRDHAISVVRTKGASWHYWSLLPLLEGWKADPKVQELLGEVLDWSDDELDMVVALIPELYDDLSAARVRLLRVAKNAKRPRVDLLIRAFGEIGCGAKDEDVIEALMPHFASHSIRDAAFGLFFVFGEHPKVRGLALEMLEGSCEPLAAAVQAFGHDEEMRAVMRQRLTPASASLRYVLTEAAAVDADRHPSLLALLEKFDVEVDFDLRVQLAISYSAFRAARGPVDDLASRLVAEAQRPGLDFEEVRSSAFAGLVQLGRATDLPMQSDRGLRIQLTDRFGASDSPALSRLIVERWEELQATFGDGWLDRFELDGHAWEKLAPYVAAYPIARRAFVDWCTTAQSLGPTALRTLADLDPHGTALRGHISFDNEDGQELNSLPRLIAAAEIAREQFYDPSLIENAISRFKLRRDGNSAVLLAILSPSDFSLVEKKLTAREIGKVYGAWLIGAYLSALDERSEQVAGFIEVMAARDAKPGYENQELMNRVLSARVGRDPNLVEHLSVLRETGMNLTFFCATAQYLVSAGKLDPVWRDDALARFEAELARISLPEVVFDVMSDAFRPAAHVLLDIVQSSGAA